MHVTGETAGWNLPPDIFLCVPRSRMFPPGRIPLILNGSLVFQSSLLENTLPRQGQALALPFYLGIGALTQQRVLT